MKYYRFPDHKLFRYGFALFMLVLLVLGRSTTYTSCLLGFYKSQLTMWGCVLLVGILFLIVNRNHLSVILMDKRMLVILLSAIYIFGAMAIKQDWQLMYVTIFLCLLFAVFLSFFLTMQEAARYYVLLLTGLALCSLIGLCILRPLAEQQIISVPEFVNPGGWPMYHFGLTFVVNVPQVMRNWGLFREPGLYQIFLMIAIQLTNYTISWKKQWHMWVVNGILFVTMLSTFATGGVIALALYVVFLFFDKSLYKNKHVRILAAAAILVCTAVIIVLCIKGGHVAAEMQYMIAKIFDGSSSMTDRVDAIVSDLMFFLRNPIVGAEIDAVLSAVPNNTSSTMILFACFGILGGLAHVFSWAVLLWKSERHVLGNLVLMVIVFITFNTQNVVHDLFFWLFPYMALVEWLLPRMNKKKV